MLYGEQTLRALENFPFSTHKVHLELIYGIVKIKKAAAEANAQTNTIKQGEANAIISACNNILNGKYDSEFITPSIQGGAGTSINMNVNEVIATLASQQTKQNIHPLDHVNASQSTNDVNPSALRIVAFELIENIEKNLEENSATCNAKAKQWKHINKLARTHLQDAIPTTVGAEFKSYEAIFKRHQTRIRFAKKCLLELNLSGTAIGSHLNASPKYQKIIYQKLQATTKLPISHAKNCMALTSSQTDFVFVGGVLIALLTDLSKIAHDIRLLSSGPHGGFGEFQLTELQAGSSIMPGKVNPVIPEVVNQIYQYCLGKQLSLQIAAERAELELGVMFPTIADCLISIIKETTEALRVMNEKCFKTLLIDEKKCQQHLEKSTAYATLLTPTLGYDVVSKAVHEAINTHQTLRQVILNKKLLTEKEFDVCIANIQ